MFLRALHHKRKLPVYALIRFMKTGLDTRDSILKEWEEGEIPLQKFDTEKEETKAAGLQQKF